MLRPILTLTLLATSAATIVQAQPTGDPLKPDARAVIERMSKSPRGISIPEQRAAITSLRGLQGHFEQVAAVSEVAFPGGDTTVSARIYRPRSDGVLPVMLWFHGGSFVKGDLDLEDIVLRRIANRSGWAIVAVDYRLAPEHPFPAANDDADAALAWLRNEGERNGLDVGRIVIGGNSAGGAIAAALAQRAAAQRLPIVGQLLVSPMLDLTLTSASWRTFGPRNWVIGTAETRYNLDLYLLGQIDRRDPRVSPGLARELAGLPPALIILAAADPARDDGRAYADRLSRSGVEARTDTYPGMIHGFFLMRGRIADGALAVDRAADWLAGLSKKEK